MDTEAIINEIATIKGRLSELEEHIETAEGTDVADERHRLNRKLTELEDRLDRPTPDE